MALRSVLVAAMLSAVSLCAAAGEGALRDAVKKARESHGIPAIGVLSRVKGHDEAIAIGLRALGDSAPVTVDDRWHIGSCTKAFTATLVARMVEAGELRFEETVAEALPDLADKMDPAFRKVTIAQLLSHTAGLPELTSDADAGPYRAAIAQSPELHAQRMAIARAYLSTPPVKPGEFRYSNIGFIIAGAIAEARAGKTWEELLRERVFAPLGITHVGFGAPGTAGKVTQPEGHKRDGKDLVALVPGPDADNEPALGPAGTINISLADWMRFAQDAMDGARGHGKLLKPETYRRLFTPVTGNYAFGWGAVMDADGIPSVLTHNGSNSYWLAEVRIFPKRDAIVLVALNVGGGEAEAALSEVDAAWRATLGR
jgi:CubicO group peptidase (beta-lactamase class C family)